MVNILVTGSKGQLGNCIRDLDYNYSNLNFIYTDYSELNISNLDLVDSFFSSSKEIHYCINCAAYTAVDIAETDIDKAYEINALGAKNLALICSKNNTVLIHISTDFVFNGNNSKPYTENDKTVPLSIYGESKLKGEQEIENTHDKHFIIRTSWLFSEYGTNFLKTMLSLGTERDEINVISDQIGTPTYAGDLARVILLLILNKHRTYGIYHYSNEGVASWYDFAYAIFDETNIDIKLLPINTEAYPSPAKRPNFSVMDKAKIKNFLNIEIPYWRHSLKACLKKII